MENMASPLVVGAAALVLVLLYAYKLKSRQANNAPPHVPGIPFIGSPDFFRKRWDFVQTNVARYGHFFSFQLLQHRVFCVAGSEARKTYFSSPEHSVSFLQGYRILFAATPQLEKVNREKQDENNDFSMLLLKSLSRARTRDTMPHLIGDIYDRVNSWGAEGQLDPFTELYSIVFQLSCRMLGAREIAEDPEAVRKLTDYYWELERGSGAMPVLLPWFPTPDKKKRQEATEGLYMMIADIMQKRRDQNRREDDTLQVLMDSGKSDPEVVQILLGFFFAAIINTGIGSAWLLLHVANNAKWRAKILQELKETMAKYQDEIPEEDDVASIHQKDDVDPNRPLQRLPLSAWEAMPVLDLAIKEVLRLTISGTSLRRVLQPGVVINGYEIPVGAFLCHSIGLTHLDEKIYKEPLKFDPDRFLPPRLEEESEVFSFIGWGVGKHPCLGMKFAKLEMKSILAVLLTSFDFQLASADGALPEPDRNNLHTTRPKVPVLVSYKALPRTNDSTTAVRS